HGNDDAQRAAWLRTPPRPYHDRRDAQVRTASGGPAGAIAGGGAGTVLGAAGGIPGRRSDLARRPGREQRAAGAPGRFAGPAARGPASGRRAAASPGTFTDRDRPGDEPRRGGGRRAAPAWAPDPAQGPWRVLVRGTDHDRRIHPES